MTTPRWVLRAALALGLITPFVACEQSNSGGTNTNWIVCRVDTDCPSDQVCVQRRCAAPALREGGAEGTPDSGEASGGTAGSGGADGSSGAGGEPGAPDGARADAEGGRAPAPADCATARFLEAPFFETGSVVTGLVVADLGGDGRPELAVLSASNPVFGSRPVAGYLRLFRHRDGLTFEPYGDHRIEHDPKAIEAADVNGDGKLDLVTANYASSVGVFLNDGAGNLPTDPVTYPVGGIPEALALGDVTGDGTADIVVTDSTANAVHVLPNQGSGTFGAAVALPIAGVGRAVKVGDLNGDDELDIVVSDSAATLRVLINDGSGGFAAPVAYGAGPGGALVLADVTGDGKLDAVVPDAVYRNSGNGTFAAPSALGIESSGTALVVADLDGKVGLDIAARTGRGVAVLLGLGGGAFETRLDRFYSGGAYGAALEAADIDGDGRVDLVSGNGDNTRSQTFETDEGSVDFFLNRGSGAFAGSRRYAASGSARRPLLADWNGDGRADVTLLAGDATPPASVRILSNDGAGEFLAPIDVESGATDPSDLDAADMDGDGRLDLVVCDEAGKVVVHRGTVDGGFAAPASYPVSGGMTRLFAGQFGGDPRPDILVGSGSNAFLLVNQGDGTLGAASAIGAMVLQAAGDADGDGDTDLLVRSTASPGLALRVSRGDGTFEDPLVVPESIPAAANPIDAALTDVDRDGRLDVVAVYGTGELTTAVPFPADEPRSEGDLTIAVFRRSGGGAFATPVVSTVRIQWGNFRGLSAGDLDDDGRVDLVLTDNDTHSSLDRPGAGSGLRRAGGYVFLNRGDDTFGTPTKAGRIAGSQSTAVADLNGDGVDDLVVTGSAGTAVFHARPECRADQSE